MRTEFLKRVPHLVYIHSANRFIRNNELERLGQGIIILKFEVRFDVYGATVVNHEKTCHGTRAPSSKNRISE